MADLAPFSLRILLAKTPRGGCDPNAILQGMVDPNPAIARAIKDGLDMLAGRAIKTRFTGKGPFPVVEHRLGIVSGRLRGSVRADDVVLLGNGYSSRMGATVEYFGAHERGFSGTVNVPEHTQSAYTVKRKEQSRISKSGKKSSIRANQYSVLAHSVRAHTRKLNIPARAPLRTAIEELGPQILGAEISKAIKSNPNPLA